MISTIIVSSIILGALVYLGRAFIIKRRMACAGCVAEETCTKSACNAFDGQKTLLELAIGQKACIRRIMSDEITSSRMRDTGIIEFAELEILGYAPLQDPIRVKIDNSITLSIRRAEAKQVLVSLVS